MDYPLIGYGGGIRWFVDIIKDDYARVSIDVLFNKIK